MEFLIIFIKTFWHRTRSIRLILNKRLKQNRLNCTFNKRMNKFALFFSVFLLSVLCACNDDNNANAGPPPNVRTDSGNFTQAQWRDSVINFGTVTKGEKVHIKYVCK